MRRSAPNGTPGLDKANWREHACPREPSERGAPWQPRKPSAPTQACTARSPVTRSWTERRRFARSTPWRSWNSWTWTTRRRRAAGPPTAGPSPARSACHWRTSAASRTMAGNPARVEDLLRLTEIWQSLGLRVTAMKGWRDRGRKGGNTFEVLGCHHTGSPGDNDLHLRDGDSKLAGPLCNVALHANGDVLLVASGRANHFGKATWENGRSLGVEATGPQTSGKKFPNYDAYVALAAGFCMFKDNVDPRRVVRGDVGIPVHLVAAHKEVAVFEDNSRLYGRKPDPQFEDPGPVSKGALAHGFSVKGSGVQLIDTFRDRVHARMTEEDISIEDAATKKFLDDKFDVVLHRLTQAVQRVGGRENAFFKSNNPDFKDLVMAEEALAEAKKARQAAEKVADELAQLKAQLRATPPTP